MRSPAFRQVQRRCSRSDQLSWDRAGSVTLSTAVSASPVGPGSDGASADVKCGYDCRVDEQRQRPSLSPPRPAWTFLKLRSSAAGRVAQRGRCAAAHSSGASLSQHRISNDGCERFSRRRGSADDLGSHRRQQVAARQRCLVDRFPGRLYAVREILAPRRIRREIFFIALHAADWKRRGTSS